MRGHDGAREQVACEKATERRAVVLAGARKERLRGRRLAARPAGVDSARRGDGGRFGPSEAASSTRAHPSLATLATHRSLTAKPRSRLGMEAQRLRAPISLPSYS